MIPGMPDCDYHRGETPFTVEEIRFFKESFDDYQLIDKGHQVFKDFDNAKTIGYPVDSFILNKETTYELVNGGSETYPVGTWMLTANVTDPTSQEEVLAGELTGWSPSVQTERIAKLLKKAMAMKSSAGQLIHDIPNPNTVTVSLVKKPCQHGSKQCKIDGSDLMSDEKKTLDKIRELLAGDKPEYATKSDFEALADELKNELKESNEAAIKSMGETISETLKEALAPLGSTKAKKDDDTDPEPDDEGDSKPQPGNGEGDPEEEEEEDDKKPKKGKGKSKTPPTHNGATKSDYDKELDTYAFLGRKPDGTVKKNKTN